MLGKHAIYITICWAVVVAEASVCFCHAQVQMEWKLTKGSRWHVELVQTTRTTTQTGARQDEISMATAMELGWLVDDVDADGAIHLTQTCQRFRLKSDMPDAEPVEYDSASSDEPGEALKAIAHRMRPLIGMRHRVVLSRRGEIVKVECPPETESLLGDLPEMARWKQMLTRDGINRVLRQALGVLPAAPVSSGERWTSSHRFESPFGALAIATNYRYEGPRRLKQRIVQYISAEMETSVVDQDSPESLAARLGPKQQGVYYFDAAKGCLAESHLTQTVRSQVPYAGTKIGVVSTGTLTLRIHHREN